MNTGRWGTALALVTVLAIIAATVIGLSVPRGSGGGAPNDSGHGDEVDWQPEPSLTGGLQRFTSLEEMESFLATAPAYPGYWYLNGQGGAIRFFSADGWATAEASAPDYSATNIQVAGVDEADIVKSDGQFIYLSIDNRLVIARAYPPEDATVVWEREFDSTIAGLFINGDRLAVLESGWPVYATGWSSVVAEILPGNYRERTSIRVYDISDRQHPQLDRELSVDGNYVSARMIGDYMYLIASGWARTGEDNVTLPRINGDDGTVRIQAEDVWHSETSDSNYCFTTIISVNVSDKDEEASHETLLVGSASTVYVSPGNIYVTYPDWSGTSGQTSVHRIHIDQGRIEYQATGEVPGSLLNQFSMDESGRYFRVATTIWNANESSFQGSHTNNVYVLDGNLDISGRLEGLAPGEQIHSARFMGSRCYLVTFQKVDPLFVIDLTDPAQPRVLGELKITGYSDYLHPYDENHIIGIGKETEAAEEGNFAWYQGVKVSLFDVSDVANPIEIAKYEIGDRGTDSPVLYDHKAFLFDASRNLLVLPVSEAKIDSSQYAGEIPSWAYGNIVWQGAYVFDISLQGLALRGKVTHCGDLGSASGRTSTSPGSSSSWQTYQDCSIERSLYIGNVLYTISDRQIGLNDLETLAEIGEISLD